MFGRFLCIGRSRLQNNSFGLSLSILDRRGAKIKVTICRSNGSWGRSVNCCGAQKEMSQAQMER